MATIDNRQLVSKITFFPSYPLYAYANGIIKDVTIDNVFGISGSQSLSGGTISDDIMEKIYSLISLNPSKKHYILSGSGSSLQFDLQQHTENFYMILGHNFNESSQTVSFDYDSSTDSVNSALSSVEYDGWSVELFENYSTNTQKLEFGAGASNFIGTVLFGQSWETPQNCDIGQTHQVSYGNKIKKTLGGKNLSTSSWNGPSKWGDLFSWELLPHSEKDSTTGTQYGVGQGGIRTWSVNFSQVQSKYLMSQNNMSNSYGWNQDSTSNYEVDASSDSLYNKNTGIDFYTNVYSKTMGSHLPCVVRISESNNNDQWAIVRISDYKVTEANPKLLNISLTLEEQV